MFNRRFFLISCMILCSHIHLNATLTYEHLHNKASDLQLLINNIGIPYYGELLFENDIKSLFSDDFTRRVNGMVTCNSRENFIQKLRIYKTITPYWFANVTYISADEQKQSVTMKYFLYRTNRIITQIIAIVFFDNTEKFFFISEIHFNEML